MLTQEQQEWALKQVVRWLEHCPHSVIAEHAKLSGLLPRLLSGLDPLPKCPPLIGGRPCYDLYNGKDVPLGGGPVEVQPLPQKAKKSGEYYSPSLQWNIAIEDRLDYVWNDKDKGLLTHRNGDIFKVWRGEYESFTLYGKEPYLEDRWLMRLHERVAPVVVDNDTIPEPTLRPRRQFVTGGWHNELRAAPVPANWIPANPHPDPQVHRAGMEEVARRATAGPWDHVVAGPADMVFNAAPPEMMDEEENEDA